MLNQAGVWLLVPYPRMKQAFFLFTISIVIMSKLTKMSLSNIQGVLSREEMSKIMAGSGGGLACGRCTPFGGGSSEACYLSGPPGGPQQCIGCGNMCTY